MPPINFDENIKIVIDCRMIRMSGIGRYIQSLLQGIVHLSSNIVVLGNLIEINSFPWANHVEIISFDNSIYSVSEQIKYLKSVPKCDLFIAPHYNVPVVLPQAKYVAVVIPDVNHLVFKEDLSLAKNLYAKLFYNLAVKKDLLFTISEFSKSEIIKYTHTKNEIFVAKCAIDKDYFDELKHKILTEKFDSEFTKYVGGNYLLYVGNIKPHKNLKRSLLAFEKVLYHQPDMKFLIVGKKDNFLTKDKEVFDLVANNPILQAAVEFTGKISDLELVYLYTNARMLLFVSLYEGFGLPPLEAMNLGCPVLCSGEGSLPEICGDAALYCDGYATDSISDGILNLLTDSELRSKKIMAGYEKVKEYDWDLFNYVIISNISKFFKKKYTKNN